MDILKLTCAVQCRIYTHKLTSGADSSFLLFALFIFIHAIYIFFLSLFTFFVFQLSLVVLEDLQCSIFNCQAGRH